MTLREFLVRIGIKFDKKGAKSADASIAKLKKAVIRLAAVFGAIRVANFIRRTALEMAALADRIDKVSDKLGVSAQALQEFRFAAQLTGVEQRTLDLALQRFTRRAAEAAMGTGEAKDTLARLGIQLTDTNGVLRPTSDLLGDVAEAMSKMEGDGERLAAGFKLFDSEGAGLVVTLKGGRAALEAMREEARALGGVLTDEDIKAGREFTDTMTKMRFAFRTIQLALSKAIIPLFQILAEETTGLIKASRGFIKLALVEVFGRIVRIVGAYVVAIVQVLRMLSEWFRKQADVTKAIALTFTALLALIGLFSLANAPLFILLALIGLILDDILTFQRGGVSAIGDFINSIDDLLLAMGPLGDVLRFVFGLWADGLNLIKELAFTLLDFWINVFTEGFSTAWTVMVRGLKTTFFGFLDSLIERFVRFANAMGQLIPAKLRAKLGVRDFSVAEFRGLVGLGGGNVTAPGTGGGRPNVSTSTSVNVNVTGAPGMDEEALAGAVAKGVRRELETANRNALDTLTPAPAPAPTPTPAGT